MNREMMTKLQDAKSVREVISIAKEYGQEITEKKAGELLDRLNVTGGELPDDALEAVAGGVRQKDDPEFLKQAWDFINARQE